jgi:acylphosphatase
MIDDTLVNFERVQFADKLIAVDINGNAGQAYRLYKAALDRTPDPNGLAGWIKYMDDGSALTSMAQQFIDSQEFRAKYGALDNTGFVNQLYVNVLARKGEAAGVEGWVNGLANGLTRAQVLAGFSESSENQANVIGQIKNGIPYVEWWLA